MKPLECETLVRNMQNLKHKKDLDGIRMFRCLKLLFIEAKAFMKVAEIGDAFLIYILPSPDVEPHPHDIFPNIKNLKMCLRRKM